jgi:dTDP-4-dehydrorhamnose 3,5-epimerase
MSKSSYIDGVEIIELKEFVDRRGRVQHGHNLFNPAFDFLPPTVGEVYFSSVNPGVVKAWHFHKEMWLRYVVVSGTITLGLFDDREGSPTRGHPMKVQMAENGTHYKMVIIPPGVWNGFRATEHATRPAKICNISSMPHDPDEIVRKPPDAVPWGLSWGDYDREVSG